MSGKASKGPAHPREQYLRALADFLLGDLRSDNPVRHTEAIRRLARVRPAFAGQAPATVLDLARLGDALDAVALEQGFGDWRGLKASLGEDDAWPRNPVPDDDRLKRIVFLLGNSDRDGVDVAFSVTARSVAAALEILRDALPEDARIPHRDSYLGPITAHFNPAGVTAAAVTGWAYVTPAESAEDAPAATSAATATVDVKDARRLRLSESGEFVADEQRYPYLAILDTPQTGYREGTERMRTFKEALADGVALACREGVESFVLLDDTDGSSLEWTLPGAAITVLEDELAYRAPERPFVVMTAPGYRWCTLGVQRARTEREAIALGRAGADEVGAVQFLLYDQRTSTWQVLKVPSRYRTLIVHDEGMESEGPAEFELEDALVQGERLARANHRSCYFVVAPDGETTRYDLDAYTPPVVVASPAAALDQYGDPVPADLVLLDNELLHWATPKQLKAVDALEWYVMVAGDEESPILVSDAALRAALDHTIFDTYDVEDGGFDPAGAEVMRVARPLHRWNTQTFYHA